MPTINGKQIKPDGSADTGNITISLMPSVQTDGDNNQVTQTDITVTPNASGVWTVTLEATDDMGCPDAHYIFTFSDGTREFKDVPALPDPVDYSDLVNHY